jgi:hypothetical protein
MTSDDKSNIQTKTLETTKKSNYVCPSCNHISIDGCLRSPTKCDECGTRINMYDGIGYDEIDTDNEYNYTYKKSKHVKINEDLNQYKYEDIGAKITKIPKSDESDENQIEHMSGDQGGGFVACISCQLVLFIFVLFIAYKRGEIENKDKTWNKSLLLCIFFFPQLYISYALVEWLTHPRHLQ